MKFYNIALFVFLFNLALSIVNSLNLTSAYAMPAEQWNLPTNVTYTGSGLSTATVLFGDFVKALAWFIDAFAKATVLLPELIKSFGFPDIIAWAIASAVWFVYLAGIIQFVSGRSFGVIQ
jgi:hypothetical protein